MVSSFHPPHYTEGYILLKNKFLEILYNSRFIFPWEQIKSIRAAFLEYKNP